MFPNFTSSVPLSSTFLFFLFPTFGAVFTFFVPGTNRLYLEGIETADTGSGVRGSSAIEVGESDGGAIACEGLLTKALSMGRGDNVGGGAMANGAKWTAAGVPDDVTGLESKRMGISSAARER
jgi:hypothetical protein